MSRRILPIIYNLKAYLDGLSLGLTLPIIPGGMDEADPREAIYLIDNGGDDRPYYDRKDLAIQALVRSYDRVLAGKEAAILSDAMRGGWSGVELPEVTEGGTTYPAVTAWRFAPQGAPGYTGTDANRLQAWSANFIVTI
jgi:hypothetical protein